MRNTIHFLAIFMIANIVLSEDSKQEERTEHETYIWLEREGIFDPEVSTSEVHELLSKGLNHDDPKIVHCAISAIKWYSNLTSELRIIGKTPDTDRRLGELPGLYNLLTGIWDKGWKEAGGVVPKAQYSASRTERWTNKTACLAPDPIWTSLTLTLAYLFPGDEKVYEIIWKHLPQISPGSLLTGLFEGKFNNPKDIQHRINLLTNRETKQYWSRLAARSLGDFRSERGLETLVQVLEKDDMEYGTPKFVIVDAMIKYDEDATPHIELMRETLENTRPIGTSDRDLMIALKECLSHFEEKYAEEVEQPSL